MPDDRANRLVAPSGHEAASTGRRALVLPARQTAGSRSADPEPTGGDAGTTSATTTPPTTTTVAVPTDVLDCHGLTL